MQKETVLALESRGERLGAVSVNAGELMPFFGWMEPNIVIRTNLGIFDLESLQLSIFLSSCNKN